MEPLELPTTSRSWVAPVMATSIVWVAEEPVIVPEVKTWVAPANTVKTTEPLVPTASSTPTSALKRWQLEIA